MRFVGPLTSGIAGRHCTFISVSQKRNAPHSPHLIGVADIAVRDEKDLSGHAGRGFFLENRLQRFQNFRTAHVGIHGALQSQSFVEGLLIVGTTAFGEEQRVIAAERNDVEGAAHGQRFKQQQKRLFGGGDAVAAHRTRPVHDEDEFGLLQLGALDGGQVGEEVEGDDVLSQEAGGHAGVPATGRHHGHGRHLTIVGDFDAQIVVEFVVDDAHGGDLLGSRGEADLKRVEGNRIF